MCPGLLHPEAGRGQSSSWGRSQPPGPEEHLGIGDVAWGASAQATLGPGKAEIGPGKAEIAEGRFWGRWVSGPPWVLFGRREHLRLMPWERTASLHLAELFHVLPACGRLHPEDKRV